MKAVVLPGDETVTVRDLPTPEPGFGEVLIKVMASAVCGSDMSVFRGNQLVGDRQEFPVPGHEVAGVVASTGPGVTGVERGDRVAVYLAVGCLRCEYCLSGYLMLCGSLKTIGFDLQGGDAEYICVPAYNCMPLPEGLGFAEAAVSTDMFGTQFSIQRRLGVSGADTVLVSGVGPMGAAAVATAKANGAKVIAVDPVAHRRDLAQHLGADEVVDSVTEEILGIGRFRGRGGPDVVIECSGNARAQTSALDIVRPLGRVAFVGENSNLSINPSGQLLRKLTTVLGSWYFPRWEYSHITDFLLERKVPVGEIISHRLILDDAPKAFQMLAERTAEKMIFEPEDATF
jgi:propanol-preferring alcohol dehydrogenase